MEAWYATANFLFFRLHRWFPNSKSIFTQMFYVLSIKPSNSNN